MAPDAGCRGDDRAAGTGNGQRDRHGDRRARAGRALQSPRPRDRQPSHLRPRLRRRHDGGDLGRGLLARRAFETGQADVPLRRQPGHARRPGVARLHRRRRPPLRGLRLAGPAGRRWEHGPARDPRSPGAGQARAEPADPDRRANDARLRLTPQGRHFGSARKPARQGGSRADEEGPRMAVGGALFRAAGGAGAFPDGRRARGQAPGGLGKTVRGVREEVSGARGRVAAARARRAPRGVGRGPAGIQTRSRRSCRN